MGYRVQQTENPEPKPGTPKPAQSYQKKKDTMGVVEVPANVYWRPDAAFDR